jgi:hypothetical protein
MNVTDFPWVSQGSSTVQLHDSPGSGKRKTNDLNSFCQNTKMERGQSYFESTTGMARLRGSAR